MENNPKYIFKDLCSSVGSGESSKVYLSTNMDSGKSELVIEKTITERYPTKDYAQVMNLHERLNAGGGRRLWKLSELC